LADGNVDSVEADPPIADLAVAGTVEIVASETPPITLDPVETEAVGAVDANPTETAAVENDAVGSSIVATDDIASPETSPDELADGNVDSIEADLPIADLAPAGTVAASETPPITLDPVETEADAEEAGAVDANPIETAAVSTDGVAPPLAASDDLCETEPATVGTRFATLPAAKPDEPADREALIRRRWNETGIMMWNPRVHGAGQSTLCIQGSATLLPPKPGETMPQYDRLEFKLIDGLIICEGFVVEPPEPLKSRSFARTAIDRAA
jgi:hypothetical protein